MENPRSQKLKVEKSKRKKTKKAILKLIITYIFLKMTIKVT